MKTELSFEFYKEWFKGLSTEHQETLIENDMAPDVVKAAYQLRVASDAPKSALREFRSTIEYRAHYLTSPPHIQRELARMGITENTRVKDDHKVATNRWNNDAADSPAASHRATADMAAVDDDDEVMIVADKFNVPITLAKDIIAWRNDTIEAVVMRKNVDGIKTIVAWLLQEANIKIAAGALAFAAGLDALNGIGSQSEFALRIGVTRAAVSKKVRIIKTFLNLPVNPHMKSLKACAQYKKNGLTNHWRKQKYTSKPKPGDASRNNTARRRRHGVST